MTGSSHDSGCDEICLMAEMARAILGIMALKPEHTRERRVAAARDRSRFGVTRNHFGLRIKPCGIIQ